MVVRYINARKALPWKMNQLLQHVERTWAKVSNDPADPTNNATERIIGLTFKPQAVNPDSLQDDAGVQGLAEGVGPSIPVELPAGRARGL
jgi:hypothetical protein